MKYLLCVILLPITVLTQNVLAQKKTTQLTDRNLFFDPPVYSDFKLSPDGAQTTFIRYNGNSADIYIKKTEEKIENARPLTNIQHVPPLEYHWTKDGKFIITISGNKDSYNVYSTQLSDPFQPNRTVNLISQTKFRPVLFHLSEKKPENIFLGVSPGFSKWLDLYQLNLFSGEKNLLFPNLQQIQSYYLDGNDSLRLLSKTDESANELVLNIHSDTIIQTSVKEKPDIRYWNKDNNKFYYIANNSQENLSALYEYDLSNQKTKLVYKDPENKADIYNIYFDTRSKELAGVTYFYEKPVTYWQSTYWKAVYDSIQSKFTDKAVVIEISDSAKDRAIFKVSSDRSPASYYYFDIKSNKEVWIADAYPEIKKIEAKLSPTQGFYYKSSDGTDIPAYITYPEVKKKKLPLIVLIRDHPFDSRIYWEYQPFVQFLASRGYAVFQPNYRGSNGYGMQYKETGYQQLGILIQNDITSGVNYLIKQGTVDPKHVILIGIGLGGHAVFTGLQQNPELYNGGISIYGIHQLETLVKSVPEFWNEKQKKYWETIGNPYDTDGLKKLQAQSPFYNISKVTKPVFVIQKTNDARSRLNETNYLVTQLHKNTQVQYMLAEDRDSNYSEEVIYASIEQFLSDLTKTHSHPDISKKLNESIRQYMVHIDSLKFPDISDFIAERLPPFKFPLRNNEYIYNVSYQYDNQSLSFIQYRKIKYENSRWQIQYFSNTPHGEKTETAYYNSSFMPSYINVSGTQGKSEISFAERNVYFNNQYAQKEIKAPLSFLIDGPGLDLVIGNLPMKKGFQIKTYILDEQSEKFKPCIVKVVNEETVRHQDFWIVEITCVQDQEDKITLWLNKRNHLLYKSVRQIPSMGNTVITTTLQD